MPRIWKKDPFPLEKIEKKIQEEKSYFFNIFFTYKRHIVAVTNTIVVVS